MSKTIDLKLHDKLPRKEMKFKNTYFIKVGSSGQWFILDQNEKIIDIQYSQSKAQEVLDYYKAER